MAMDPKNWIAFKSYRYSELVALAILPKNGSTSFRNVLPTPNTYNNTEALVFDKRISFIRNPKVRHISGFSFFYMLNDTHQNSNCNEVPRAITHNPDGTPKDTAYENYVDLVLSAENKHWHPQSLLLESVPTDYYRFNDIDNVWNHYWHRNLPVMNRSNKQPINDYRLDELKVKYAGDIALFRSIPRVTTPMFTKPSEATNWW